MTWAVVTGAANGIGAVIAQHAAKAGFSVSAWDIDEAKVFALAERIGRITPQHVDVADEEAVSAALETLPEPPALLVNNDWNTVLQVNLTGTFIVARAAATRMAAAGSGSIVNVASINGVAVAPSAGAYTAGKAAVVKLTEQMALEWSDHGIRVNAVSPGLIDAGMSEPIYSDPDTRRVRTAHVPMRRLGSAEDVADAVMFLASPQASYITGQNIVVDGGITKAALARLPRG
jgi:NAD(P)-dependent dehydrogenase (short-subunit alcohol dehydrogenase family)